MIKRIFTILTLVFIFGFTTITYASETDDSKIEYYEEIMVDCVANGEAAEGKIASVLRALEIKSNDSDNTIISYDDLNWLSKIMDIEAGACQEEFYKGVGEVVLNRVDSPEFPNTIKEVLNQENPRQYYGNNSVRLKNHVPQKQVVEAALDLLKGERNLIPTVIYHSAMPLGAGSYKAYYDNTFGWFHLSLTQHPELYK